VFLSEIKITAPKQVIFQK